MDMSSEIWLSLYLTLLGKSWDLRMHFYKSTSGANVKDMINA